MGVEKSAYRQPVTPQGLKAIEKGTLTWLDDDMYNNLNTGVLEQYLEEKNLQESFEVSHWSTPKVFYGIAIGAVFSGVTAYIVSNSAWRFLLLGILLTSWVWRSNGRRQKSTLQLRQQPVPPTLQRVLFSPSQQFSCSLLIRGTFLLTDH